MDVHPPHRPILTIREAIAHLTIVTVGILIALSLEGLLEWVHHRSLVREAIVNLTSELRDNQKALEENLRGAPQLRGQLATMGQAASAMSRNEKPSVTSLQLAYGIATLRRASHATAEVTGAFGFMQYAQVKRYAGVYDLQNRFERLQDQMLSDVLAVLSSTQLFDEHAEATPRDIEEFRRQIRAAAASLTAIEQIGGALEKAYVEILAQ